MTNLWQNPTKSIPMRKPDGQIIRTPMDQNEIAGRKDHLPNWVNTEASIKHVPSEG